MRHKVLFLCFCMGLGISFLCAASLLKEESLELISGVWQYTLSSAPLISGSESIESETGLLTRDKDYQIDYKTGQITFLSLQESHFVFVSYILIPASLSKPKQLYQQKVLSDSLLQNIKPTRMNRTWQTDGKLMINGSKTFAISFADDSFELLQSLYVQLNGELSDRVSILAQLSDSQSKLSPEGDSKELSSLDQVFIKLYSSLWALSMGDLELKYEGSRYLDYYSRFEGIDFRLGKQDYIQAAYLAGGGKNSFCELKIIDGKQGPYYLNPQGEPGSLLVIAGSENVYVNGIQLERGRDYYIDYSEGSLMFNNMVYTTDKVSVWFKYTDENYPRHGLLSSSNFQLLPGLNISHRFVSAFDSKHEPLLFEFSAEDLDSLRLAGDRDVWGNGAMKVEPGQGLYRLLVNDEGLSYFEYAQADSLADYLVVFSYVGSGAGDYEQFSHGKYRYVGRGLGDWLPIKRLVAPNSTINSSLRGEYQSKNLNLGMEALVAHHDGNTLSKLDDKDNLGAYLFAWMRYQSQSNSFKPQVSLEYEKRWAQTMLLSDYSSQISGYDQGNLLVPDSLAMQRIGVDMNLDIYRYAKPRFSLQYIRADNHIRQLVWRLGWQNKAWSLLPASNISSTITNSSGDSQSLDSAISMTNNGDVKWQRKWLSFGAVANQQSYSALDKQKSNKFLRLNPYIEIGNKQTALGHLSLNVDRSESKIEDKHNKSESNTYILKQQINTLNHNLLFQYNHRSFVAQADSSRSRYDLINHRSSNSFFNRALLLITNYQLNQTEFFPKIRELQYIGHGLGTVDSTGVITQNGDWDWVYITASKGSLSSENHLQASIFFKPASISSYPLFKRISTDVSVLGTMQLQGDKSAFFRFPFVFKSNPEDEKLINHNQNYQQNIWLDLIPGKLSSQITFENMQNTDRRYQDLSHNTKESIGIKLDLNRIGNNSYSLSFQKKEESDSRYGSKLSNQNVNGLIMRQMSKQSILRMDCLVFEEKGYSMLSDDSFQLWGMGFQPSYRGVFSAKARFLSELKLQYNQRDKEGFLGFMPDKRGGFIMGTKFNLSYRINDFSSVNLDYSLNSYPKESLKHQFKLEFRAEL